MDYKDEIDFENYSFALAKKALQTGNYADLQGFLIVEQTGIEPVSEDPSPVLLRA